MVGYLSVTDTADLTPRGMQVVAKTFLPRGEYVPSTAASDPPPPYSAGTTARLHPFTRPVYNAGSPAAARLRGAITAALHAGHDYLIACLGDSKTEGTGTDGEAYDYAWPGVLRRILGGVEGFVPANETGNQWDDRWTATGMVRAAGSGGVGTMGVVQDSDAPSMEVVFASGFAHNGASWGVHIPAGGNVDVVVDGGSVQSFTVPAGDGFTTITPTVTGDTAHTYAVSSTDPGFHVLGIVPTYPGPRLKIARMGRGGSRAMDWVPDASPTHTGLWDAVTFAAPDAVLCEIGTNGTAQGQQNADAVTALWAAIAALDVPAVVMTPGGLGGTTGREPIEVYAPVYAALWDAADAHDLPLFDFQSVTGDRDRAGQLGLMSDQLHENRVGYAFKAAGIHAMLNG